MNNQSIINEIRSKIDIVDLISEYIPLVQKGKNYFGVCPFHNDTNPSMSVSREKQIYKCFSCGASGNIFTFVSEYENISFKEALHFLAEKVGYKLDNIKIQSKPNINEKYYEMYDLTAKFYQNNINTTAGKAAKEYLKNRNIDDDIIKKFSLPIIFLLASIVFLIISSSPKNFSSSKSIISSKYLLLLIIFFVYL